MTRSSPPAGVLAIAGAEQAIGVPMERLSDSGARVVRWASRLDQLAATVLPSLFAYQYLFEIRPVSRRVADHLAPSPGR